jgi:hypothetical protein
MDRVTIRVRGRTCLVLENGWRIARRLHLDQRAEEGEVRRVCTALVKMKCGLRLSSIEGVKVNQLGLSGGTEASRWPSRMPKEKVAKNS